MFSYIAPGAKQYRANLHSHTNLSDGTLTPEQMVQAYQEKGYSILAITDHEAPYDHTALSTDNFLMLTGYEAYIRPSPTCEFDLFKPEIHLNLLAKVRTTPPSSAGTPISASICRWKWPSISGSTRATLAPGNTAGNISSGLLIRPGPADISSPTTTPAGPWRQRKTP